MATLVGNTAPVDKAEILPDNYRYLQDYIYRESGIVIDKDKHYLLEARLLPVAKKRNLRSVNDLCALMRATAPLDLKQQIVEAMTTHETLFFRDPNQYEALRKTVLPELMDQRGALRRLSFWSAACSSGQEAYSLAMMLSEIPGLAGWNVNITGTDLSEQILGRARQGMYSQLEVNRGLPVTSLVKHFTRQGLDWQLKENIRKMASFRTFDLRQSMRGLGPFDVVFCRNVLIYFDQDTKRKILEEIRGTINRGGYLLLGGAETAMAASEKFERVQLGGAVFYRVL